MKIILIILIIVIISFILITFIRTNKKNNEYENNNCNLIGGNDTRYLNDCNRMNYNFILKNGVNLIIMGEIHNKNPTNMIDFENCNDNALIMIEMPFVMSDLYEFRTGIGCYEPYFNYYYVKEFGIKPKFEVKEYKSNFHFMPMDYRCIASPLFRPYVNYFFIINSIRMNQFNKSVIDKFNFHEITIEELKKYHYYNHNMSEKIL